MSNSSLWVWDAKIFLQYIFEAQYWQVAGDGQNTRFWRDHGLETGTWQMNFLCFWPSHQLCNYCASSTSLEPNILMLATSHTSYRILLPLLSPAIPQSQKTDRCWSWIDTIIARHLNIFEAQHFDAGYCTYILQNCVASCNPILTKNRHMLKLNGHDSCSDQGPISCSTRCHV